MLKKIVAIRSGSVEWRTAGQTWVIQPAHPGTSENNDQTMHDHYVIFSLPSDPRSEGGRVCVTALLDFLGRQQITSLLVEGGMRVHQAFFAAGLVNEVSVSVSPVIVGGAAQAQKIDLTTMHYESVGQDICFNATLN